MLDLEIVIFSCSAAYSSGQASLWTAMRMTHFAASSSSGVHVFLHRYHLSQTFEQSDLNDVAWWIKQETALSNDSQVEKPWNRYELSLLSLE